MAIATVTMCRYVRNTGPMITAVLSAPMSMRMGSGVNTMASTFSSRMSRPSEAMKMLVRKAPRRSSCW